MLFVYIGCLAFGILYSLGALILGGHDAGHGGGFDHGGGDVHAGDSADMPSPFNPLVMASAISTFGAAGLVGKIGFGMGDIKSSLLGLVFAGIIGTVMFFGVVRFMYNSQSDSTFSISDLAGYEGEVITPIPEKGMGEISYLINGVRYSIPARALEGSLNRGEAVRIKEVSGGIAYVSRKLTLEDLDSIEIENRESDQRKNKNM